MPAEVSIKFDITEPFGGPATDWGRVFPKNKQDFLKSSGAYVRTVSRRNLRAGLVGDITPTSLNHPNSPYGAAVQARRNLGGKVVGRKPSKPGQKPKFFDLRFRNSILFDTKLPSSRFGQDAVAIGPQKFNGRGSNPPAGNLLEYGGRSKDLSPNPFKLLGLNRIRYEGRIIAGIFVEDENNQETFFLQGFPKVRKSQRLLFVGDSPKILKDRSQRQKNRTAPRPFMLPALNSSWRAIQRFLKELTRNG